jgi:hypothetical protein
MLTGNFGGDIINLNSRQVVCPWLGQIVNWLGYQ